MNTTISNQEKVYLTPQEVEAKFNLPKATLANWRFHGRGPAYLKIGSKILYDPKDIHLWLLRHKVSPESEPRDFEPVSDGSGIIWDK